VEIKRITEGILISSAQSDNIKIARDEKGIWVQTGAHRPIDVPLDSPLGKHLSAILDDPKI